MNRDNIALKTDSYKLGHRVQYPEDTQGVFSYFESRVGAEYPETVFFGLQSLLKTTLVGQRVTDRDVAEAATLSEAHFGPGNPFRPDGWQRIVDVHDGFLPVRIRAVPEGTPVPTGNVLM